MDSLAPEPAFAKKSLKLRLTKGLSAGKAAGGKAAGAKPLATRTNASTLPAASRSFERANRAQLVELQQLFV